MTSAAALRRRLGRLERRVPDARAAHADAELVGYLQRVSDEELDVLEAATMRWHEEGRPLTVCACRTILAQWDLGE